MARLPDEQMAPARKCDVIVSSPALKRSQWWLTWLVATVPAIGTLIAVAWGCVRPIGYTEVRLLVTLWIISSGLGISVGYHRFLVHRSFEAGAVVRFVLSAAGATAFQGPPLYWAAIHRRHHELSDGPGDPHSPHSGRADAFGRLRALFHAHVGWMATHGIPSTVHYVPDLLKDRTVMYVNRHYFLIAIAALLLPAAIAGAILESWEGALAGFLWGGLLRLFLVSHFTWITNSICHAFGSRDYDTADDSRNVGFLAIPTFGESWHNNHHAFPSSARHGVRWWQLDLGYLMIWGMARLGLVSNVRTSR
jgi:stearoyl-CoA desaturase (delta-9 desaturase)